MRTCSSRRRRAPPLQPRRARLRRPPHRLCRVRPLSRVSPVRRPCSATALRRSTTCAAAAILVRTCPDGTSGTTGLGRSVRSPSARSRASTRRAFRRRSSCRAPVQ
ncbi:hypothetical protein ACFPRL_32290 [Pseudoclavibacter helvolus]